MISIFSIALFLYNIFRRGWVLPVLGVGLWAFVAVVAGTILPTLVQKFQVEPSESTKEKPYIERNIAATRAAMNLDNVTMTNFSNDNKLTTGNLLSNQDTVDNVRLWDPNIMPETYRALQGLKPFYKINDVDVDRYVINGNLTQVVLSARELNSGGVPQQSWEGTHLAFTHGYGVVLSSSSAQTSDGQPDQLIRGIPITNGTDITLNQPDVYFGQGLDGYVVVNSKRQEVDFEDVAGNNQVTNYSGKDGVELNSWIKRAAFALRFGDFNRSCRATSRLVEGAHQPRHQLAAECDRTVPHVRRRSVPRHPRRQGSVDRRRVQHDGSLPVRATRGDRPEQLAARPFQLRAQLGEGRDRRV